MTVPSLQNNFIGELVKQLQVLAKEQFGKDMANLLAVEHDVLILFNPEQTFCVDLLAITNKNLPPTTASEVDAVNIDEAGQILNPFQLMGMVASRMRGTVPLGVEGKRLSHQPGMSGHKPSLLAILTQPTSMPG